MRTILTDIHIDRQTTGQADRHTHTEKGTSHGYRRNTADLPKKCTIVYQHLNNLSTRRPTIALVL